jgi:protein-glucosylgalactosylhydroxylysine glucosidase
VNNPLSVGNGQFCFTVDATGLQTFPEAFEQTIPLGTLSDWGWHTAPNPNGWDVDKFEFKKFRDLNGRLVPYCDVPGNNKTPEIQWLRANPHRLHLGQIGFVLRHADGSLATTNDLKDIEQKLDLWNGEIVSHFVFDGQPVDVETVADPNEDGIAVRVESPLLKTHRLGISIKFPYGTGETITADWNHPDAHETQFRQMRTVDFVSHPMNICWFFRQLDNYKYAMRLAWNSGQIQQVGKHEFVLDAEKKGKALEFTAFFAPQSLSSFSDFKSIRTSSAKNWKKFWQTGGAIDLHNSKDPRWFELERRIVLSQYLTAIQDVGKNPPQETGLTYNTWEGKFHLEMHWWHEAQFALWNRLPLLEKSLDYYQQILPRAEGTAKKQGYAGARWRR